jgi:hypothetical protein
VREERLNKSIELRIDRLDLRSLGSTKRRRKREPGSQRQAGDDDRTEHISSCETFSHAHPEANRIEFLLHDYRLWSTQRSSDVEMKPARSNARSACHLQRSQQLLSNQLPTAFPVHAP